jgi:hypothetical protein
LSAVRDCLFNILADPPYPETAHSIRNLKALWDVVAKDPMDVDRVLLKLTLNVLKI